MVRSGNDGLVRPPVPIGAIRTPGTSSWMDRLNFDAGRAPRAIPRDGIISGYVLKLARESIDHTQVEIAQQLRIDPQTVHSWETGRRSLAATNVRDLVDLRLRLFNLGVDTALVDSLNPALEADYIISQMVVTERD